MHLKNQITPIHLAKAAWIGVNQEPIFKKGQWHKWITSLYNFIIKAKI